VTHRAVLALGTGQFSTAGSRSGLPRARVGEDQVRAILDEAAAAGVALVDTAPGYGDVERTLGCSWPFPSPFQVTLKTLPLEDSVDRVIARARRSLDHMGLARGYAVLVQDASDLLGRHGHELWTRLHKLKAEGVVQKVGVVLTMDDEPVHLARRFRPDVVQIACSVLDQRPVETGVLAALADQGVEIHLRSVFLRGLLFMAREDLPAALVDAGPRLSRIRRSLAEAGADPMQAALAFARSRPEASSIIVGARSAAELKALAAAASTPLPNLDWRELALDHPVALDPRKWTAAADLAA
jgi:aryl-alcohol dehydrogenase-like predicted oxidoreductase